MKSPVSLYIRARSPKNGGWVPSFVALEADGSSHPIYGGASNETDGSIPYPLGSTVDGSAIVLQPSNNALIARNGSIGVSSGNPPFLKIEDTNGNIEYDSAHDDSLGRAGLYAAIQNAQTITDSSGCGRSLPIVDIKLVTLPGPNGSTRQLKLCSVRVTGKTNFQVELNDPGNPGNESPIAEGTYTGNVLQSAVLYDGNSWSTSPAWTFQYSGVNQDGSNYLDLTQITFPTGGTVSYAWDNGSLDNECDNLAYVSRYITQRNASANDGSPDQISTYNIAAPEFVVVATYNGSVSPGNEKSYVQHSFAPPIPNRLSCNQYEVATTYHDLSGGSDQVLKTVQTDYTAMLNPFYPEDTNEFWTANVFPIRTTTTLSNGTVSKMETDWDSSLSVTYWDPYWETNGGYQEVDGLTGCGKSP